MMITSYMSPRAQRVCFSNGCEANIMFAIKAEMKNKPYTILLTSLMVSTAMFSY